MADLLGRLPERPRGAVAGLWAVWVLLLLGSLALVRLDDSVPVVALVVVPLIVVVARFPIVIDEGGGAIEIGFDSALLLFLLCTIPAPAAMLLWSLAVLTTQLLGRKRRLARLFNTGVGLAAGAAATVVLDVVRGSAMSEPRELLAVALAATTYFTADFVLSAVMVAVESGDSVVRHLAQRGTWIAICCFVPFDMLGYLGAILLRLAPTWTLVLLTVPLATLLVATRAVTRSRENARRLQVLLDAAVNSQTLAEPRHVVESLVEDAQRLVKLRDVVVRPEPPGASELGSQVRGGEEALWIVAPASSRARSTVQADEKALSALAAVSAAAFARLALTDDLVHLARHEPLTDLPNRAVFLDRLHYALHLARRRGHDIALAFVDLDGFKPVNDRFGHAAGDAVLVEVARRLQLNVREGDTVARLGGDEFAVLLEDVALVDVVAVGERILDAIADGFDTAEHRVHVSASIGIAHGSGAQHADEVLRNADLAMYEAKSQGKDRLVIYEPRMLNSRLERLELVEALEDALLTDALTVDYQPVVSVSTGRISGVEALARWRNDGVAVRPDLFIAAAEDNGLIAAVGASILRMVSADSAAISAAAGGDINISVNISPTQLSEPDLIDHVRLAVHNMPGARLVLEITEREGISLDHVVITAMQTISDLGVAFAIDDFGVGFSSISYLQKVPARIVKMDATLAKDIDHDDQARGLLRSIMMMSQALGHDVVVEGVERESQLDLVREDLPGAFVQGYFLHRPMQLPALLTVLQENRGTVTGQVVPSTAPSAAPSAAPIAVETSR